MGWRFYNVYFTYCKVIGHMGLLVKHKSKIVILSNIPNTLNIPVTVLLEVINLMVTL